MTRSRWGSVGLGPVVLGTMESKSGTALLDSEGSGVSIVDEFR